jgi:hypothetical protein
MTGAGRQNGPPGVECDLLMSKHVRRDQDASDAAKTREFHKKIKANPPAFMQEVYENWKAAAHISAACNSFLYRQSLGFQNAIRRLVEIGLKRKK